MYSLYYFDSFFCQNIQWLFTRFRNQKNSLDGEVLFSIHYFSLACNEVGGERGKQHLIPSLTLCVFLGMLSTLNRVTISVLIRKPAKSMAALVSPSWHAADLVFLVCFSTNAVLNHRTGFMIWWLFSLDLRKVHRISQVHTTCSLKFLMDKKWKTSSFWCCSFFTPCLPMSFVGYGNSDCPSLDA